MFKNEVKCGNRCMMLPEPRMPTAFFRFSTLRLRTSRHRATLTYTMHATYTRLPADVPYPCQLILTRCAPRLTTSRSPTPTTSRSGLGHTPRSTRVLEVPGPALLTAFFFFF